MSFLRIKRVGEARYYYIVKSVRKGDEVIPRILEYLGRDPEPARLKRALTYWGVKAKGSKRRDGKR